MNVYVVSTSFGDSYEPSHVIDTVFQDREDALRYARRVSGEVETVEFCKKKPVAKTTFDEGECCIYS